MAAVERAARRLVVVEGAFAIIGGFGVEEGRELARVAKELNVLFVNVGSTDSTLRSAQCFPQTFHVEATNIDYVNAALTYYESIGVNNWFILTEEPAGKPFVDTIESALSELGRLSGSALVPDVPVSYRELVHQIAASSADGVLTIMSPTVEEYFISSVQGDLEDVPIVTRVGASQQTRTSYYRMALSAPIASEWPRVALWEANLDSDSAADLNDLFIARFGKPMDPSGWASYAAVKILADGMSVTQSTDPDRIGEYLSSGAEFDLRKRTPVYFDGDRHQLIQPLYIVEIHSSERWGPSASEQLGIASVLSELDQINYLIDETDAITNGRGAPCP